MVASLLYAVSLQSIIYMTYVLTGSSFAFLLTVGLLLFLALAGSLLTWQHL